MVKIKKLYPLCRSRSLAYFVRDVKILYRQHGLKVPSTDKIVRYLLNKNQVKSEDLIKDDFIRF